MTTGTSGRDAEQGNTIPPRREQLAEVSVFLFLIVPSMVIGLFMARSDAFSFRLVAASVILRDLGLVSLIVFFLWRNGESIGTIGWTSRNIGKEAGLGVLLFIPFSSGAGLIERTLRALGFSAPATPLPSLIPEKTTEEFLLAALLVIVVAVAEETIFRGYLILRFRNTMASTAAAVLASAVIFSLGHGYEGPAGVVTVGVMGMVFALVYIWRQSLVAPVTMHFLQDFIGIVLLPLLGTT